MKTVLKNGNVFYQNKIQKLDVEIDGETISLNIKELLKQKLYLLNMEDIRIL